MDSMVTVASNQPWPAGCHITVFSWENHRPQYGIFQQAILNSRREMPSRYLHGLSKRSMILEGFRCLKLIFSWLVVWNILNFPIYWVANHPNGRSYFSQGWPNHQPVRDFILFYDMKLCYWQIL